MKKKLQYFPLFFHENTIITDFKLKAGFLNSFLPQNDTFIDKS